MSAPLCAAEALSSLLWLPYECQSAAGASDMRLPVPAPDHVSVLTVPGPPDEPRRRPRPPEEPSRRPRPPEEPSRRPRPPEDPSRRPRPPEEPSRRPRAPEEPRRRPRAPPPEPCPPPPYATLPQPLAVPVIAAQHRFPFQPVPIRSGRGATYACSEADGGAPKSCCGRPPHRLCVLFLGVAGACLLAAGAVLAALRPHPRAPLTLLLLMIGIGVILVAAAALAWRLGARCAALGRGARLVRLPPSSRPHHPYAAMLYPEFTYRAPPPSYHASMQDYRLRLLLLDRGAPAVSPPPTYRSNSATLVRGTPGAYCGSEYSGPPSYRAPRDSPTVHSTIPSTLEVKYPDTIEPPAEEKDPGHLVTIVHTECQPVIVTVSGSAALEDNHTPIPSEIDILAHL